MHALVFVVIGALSGVRLQGGVVADGVWSTRPGTRERRLDVAFGGELGAAPLFDGSDYVRLQTAVTGGTLGARASDGNASVRVWSTDIRWTTRAFGYYPIALTSWLSLRPGLIFGLDLSFRPTTTEVLGSKSQHTSIAPGVDYGGRIELDLWRFYVAAEGWGATIVSAGTARTSAFFGGGLGVHFDVSLSDEAVD